MKLNELTIKQLSAGYLNQEFTPLEVVEAYITAYQDAKIINAYIEFFDEAIDVAKTFTFNNRDPKALLWAIPGAIKDNFAIKGRGQTCASAILKDFVSPIDSVVVERLNQHQFINLGRVNMDEMAMGATGRYSVYGPTLNPLDHGRMVGGSSSGSAAAVAANIAAFAMGSDTGGSSRLPASYAGVCGFKPTYGAIPRSGLAAFAPSLDVPGILAKTPEDIGLVFRTVAGHSFADESSTDVSTKLLETVNNLNLKGTKIACFGNLIQYAHPSVIETFLKVEQFLKDQGAELIDINLELESVLLNTYYITACSEAASSLSRYDGARYGLNFAEENCQKLFEKTRSAGFGHEVQRRIMLGNYFLEQSHYHDWYEKGLRVRQQLRTTIENLRKNDNIGLFLLPGFNEAPLTNAPEEYTYANDLVGVFANLSGVPSLAIPVSKGEGNMPVSVQISGAHGTDSEVITLANQIFKNFVK